MKLCPNKDDFGQKLAKVFRKTAVSDRSSSAGWIRNDPTATHCYNTIGE